MINARFVLMDNDTYILRSTIVRVFKTDSGSGRWFLNVGTTTGDVYQGFNSTTEALVDAEIERFINEEI